MSYPGPVRVNIASN